MDPAVEEKIVKLWRSPTFTGSFSGLSNFRNALHEAGIKVSYSDLMRLMLKQPEYVTTLRPIRKFPRRPEIVRGLGKVFQLDLAFMPKIDSFIGFLACIDIFSRRIFCQPLKSAEASAVQAALSTIFKQSKIVPERVESDQGKEFTARSTQAFFKKHKIHFHVKVGANKASFSEHAIYVIKRRLYRLLRTIVSDDWPRYLQQIVQWVKYA